MENKKPRIRSKKPLQLVPADFIPDIISRMAVKDLMRFTCVSKSWSSLISTDPYFAHLQIQHSASLNPFLYIHKKFECSSSGTQSYYNYWIDLNSAVKDQSINLREIHNPFEDDADSPRRHMTQVRGFCRGLVLLQKDVLLDSKNNFILKMAVSNPTTKKHVVVPPNPAGDADVIVCGLGYDRVHDCYKLVTIVLHYDYDLELMVYELNKGGKWRSLQFGTWWRLRCEDSCYGYLHKYAMKCVDGCVYWCVDFETDDLREMRMMVCFLLAEEEFHVVETPDFGEVKYCPNMTLLDEKLGLVIEGLDKKHEIWSIDYVDDGKIQWRWTKLFVIMDPYAMLPSHLQDRLVLPFCFSACRNKILIRVGHELFWYDIGKNEFIALNDPLYNYCCSGSTTFFPSLVGVGVF